MPTWRPPVDTERSSSFYMVKERLIISISVLLRRTSTVKGMNVAGRYQSHLNRTQRAVKGSERVSWSLFGPCRLGPHAKLDGDGSARTLLESSVVGGYVKAISVSFFAASRPSDQQSAPVLASSISPHSPKIHGSTTLIFGIECGLLVGLCFSACRFSLLRA
jgi:hypothetical protein